MFVNFHPIIINFCYFCDMKFLCIIFLLFFTSFLSIPTIISMIDKGEDTSYFYTVSEEEENIVSFDEIKSVALSELDFNYSLLQNKSVISVSTSTFLNFTNLAHQIFSPPPDSV